MDHFKHQYNIRKLDNNPKKKAMVNFNSGHKVVLDDMLLDQAYVKPGKMFGFPAYYAGKKLCICLYEQGVALKLPEQSAKQLLEKDHNTTPFQPYGKPKMREWVQINLNRPEDYREYMPVFIESIQYVFSQQQTKD